MWTQYTSEDKVILFMYTFFRLTLEILKYLLNMFFVVHLSNLQ